MASIKAIPLEMRGPGFRPQLWHEFPCDTGFSFRQIEGAGLGDSEILRKGLGCLDSLFLGKLIYLLVSDISFRITQSRNLYVDGITITNSSDLSQMLFDQKTSFQTPWATSPEWATGPGDSRPGFIAPSSLARPGCPRAGGASRKCLPSRL